MLIQTINGRHLYNTGDDSFHRSSSGIENRKIRGNRH